MTPTRNALPLVLSLLLTSCVDDAPPVDTPSVIEKDAASPVSALEEKPPPPPVDAGVAAAASSPPVAASNAATPSTMHPPEKQAVPSGVEAWVREPAPSSSTTTGLTPSLRHNVVALHARPSTLFCTAWPERDWRALWSAPWPHLQALDVSVGDAKRLRTLFASRTGAGLRSLSLCTSRAGVDAVFKEDLSRLRQLRLETSFDVNEVLRRDRLLTEAQVSNLVRHPKLQQLNALALVGGDSEATKSLTPTTLQVLRADFALANVTHLDLRWSGANPADLLDAPWLAQLQTLCLGGRHSQSQEVLQGLMARGPWPRLQNLQLTTSGVRASAAEREKLQRRFDGRILWEEDCPKPEAPWKVSNRVTYQLLRP